MFEFEFDLQRFDDADAAQDTGAESTAAETSEEKTPLPEELNGIPEDIARETMAEWEQMQADKAVDSEPAETGRPPGAVPYDRFKEKVDEANQLKAQLAQYQQFVQQQQQQRIAQQPPQQQQTPPPEPQIKITPEVAKQINLVIEAEAMSMTGLSKEEVEEIRYMDEDDPKFEQWTQAKQYATGAVMAAIRQARADQQQQARQFLANHFAALRDYGNYVQQAMAEPDYAEIQNFAVNDFFSAMPKNEQEIIANSYLRVERQLASPAEMMVIKNYFERAKAAYRSRKGTKKTAPNTRQQPKGLPRTDQINGMATTSDGQLSERDIEKLLEGDFTEIDPRKQKIMLGLS